MVQHTGTKAAGQLHAILLCIQDGMTKSIQVEQHHNVWDCFLAKSRTFRLLRTAGRMPCAILAPLRPQIAITELSTAC